jgi:hypothetical protein
MGVITRPFNHPDDPLPEKETGQEKLPGASLTTKEAGKYPDLGITVVILPVLTVFKAPQRAADVYDLKAAAEYLNITPRKMRELFADKRVRGTKIDYRHWAFHKKRLGRVLMRLPPRTKEDSIAMKVFEPSGA